MNPIKSILELWTKDKVHLSIWLLSAFLISSSWPLLGSLLPSQAQSEKTILLLARLVITTSLTALGLLGSLAYLCYSKNKIINEKSKKQQAINMANYQTVKKVGVSLRNKDFKFFCTSCLLNNIEAPVVEETNEGWRCTHKDCGKFYPDPKAGTGAGYQCN